MYRKTGVPSEEELLDLSLELEAKWKNLARALGIWEADIEAVDEENRQVVEKCYNLLLFWKHRCGSRATYEVLEAGLCHGVVLRRDLAEKYCYSLQAIPQEHDFMGVMTINKKGWTFANQTFTFNIVLLFAVMALFILIIFVAISRQTKMVTRKLCFLPFN